MKTKKYTLAARTVKVALQHMSKKAVYQLIYRLGRSFSNRIDTQENNISSIMRYYAVGAFNHVEIIENTIRNCFNEEKLSEFSNLIRIKNEYPVNPNVILHNGYYCKWVSKRKWVVYTPKGEKTDLFVFGKRKQVESLVIIPVV